MHGLPPERASVRVLRHPVRTHPRNVDRKLSCLPTAAESPRLCLDRPMGVCIRLTMSKLGDGFLRAWRRTSRGAGPYGSTAAEVPGYGTDDRRRPTSVQDGSAADVRVVVQNQIEQ